jgi:hypothetical protein
MLDIENNIDYEKIASVVPPLQRLTEQFVSQAVNSPLTKKADK